MATRLRIRRRTVWNQQRLVRYKLPSLEPGYTYEVTY